MGNSSSAPSKRFIFHHGNSQQVVVVFPGTPAAEVLNLALRRLALSDRATVDNILLLNEDGDPIAFYPEAIPDGQHVYIHVEVAENQVSRTFEWCKDMNRHPQMRYGLSESNTVLSYGTRGPFSMAILCSNQYFTSDSGIVRWRYKWHNAGPYRSIGLLDENDYNRILTHDYGNDFSQFPLFQRVAGNYEMSGTYILDMVRHTLTVTDDGGSKTKVFRNIPEKVWVGVTAIKRNKVNSKKRLLEIFFE